MLGHVLGNRPLDECHCCGLRNATYSATLGRPLHQAKPLRLRDVWPLAHAFFIGVLSILRRLGLADPSVSLQTALCFYDAPLRSQRKRHETRRSSIYLCRPVSLCYMLRAVLMLGVRSQCKAVRRGTTGPRQAVLCMLRLFSCFFPSSEAPNQASYQASLFPSFLIANV